MEYIGGYKVRYCPKYISDEIEANFEENLLVQSTLWNAMQFLAVGKGQVSVELRFISHLPNRSISIFILLLSSSSTRSNLKLEVLERLLPEEYGWSRINSVKKIAEEIIPATSPSSSWRVSRLTRRIEFRNLPVSMPSFKEEGKNEDNEKEKSEDNIISMFGDGWKRQVLDDTALLDGDNPLEQLQGYQRCLPMLSHLTDHFPDRHRLCLEMQHGAPAILSVVLHPIRLEELENDRNLVKRWSYLLEILGQNTTGIGFSKVKELYKSYDRYWLPSDYLYHLSIRAAATQDEYALSIAQCLCSMLGGLKVFDVATPKVDFDDLNLQNALVMPTLDIPSHTLSKEKWKEVYRHLNEKLNAVGIEAINNDNQSNFLVRMPHIYTFEETKRILRLPFATRAGLPGIETQLKSPFYTATQEFQPVVDSNGTISTPPNDKIRVGLVKNSPIVGAEVENSLSNLASANWHTLPIEALCKHALIVGSTGSGKTITTLFLIRELQRLKVPFLIIEPVKTEYYDRLKQHMPDLKCFRFEKRNDKMDGFFPFDPMRLQEGVSVARHASYLKSCFEAAFPMEPWLALILESGLREYYTDSRENGGCSLTLFTLGGSEVHEYREGEGVFPSLATFEIYFCGKKDSEEVQNSFVDRALNASGNSQLAEFAQQNKEMFRRRFRNLTDGVFGEACKLADSYFKADPEQFYEPFSYYLSNGNIVLELDGVPDLEQKSLIMAFLMTFLFERRQADDLRARQNGQSPTVELKHVLVLEEAHRLLANTGGGVRGQSVGQDSRTKATSLFVDMLAEIRAFGQGIVIVEQIPTKIVPEAIKNTNLKIMLRLTSKDDRDYLGEAMNFTPEQNRFVTSLRAQPGEGVQFIVFEEGIDQPLLLSLPLPASGSVSSTWLYDDFFNV